MAKPEAAVTIRDATLAKWGRIDCLVNNAGSTDVATGMARNEEKDPCEPARCLPWPYPEGRCVSLEQSCRRSGHDHVTLDRF
jgi:NAD(P)-dependent dehydrogenase (short-subunit alcohol dehydrogenase family)